MTRMQDEANQLGASGIVGVRLEEKSHQWGSHTIEFLSLGHRGGEDLRRGDPAQADHHHLARQLMADLGDRPIPADLPEAAARRFAEGAFTSGLTVPDFAACLQMGLEPVGFVQGFCVMQWQWYGMGGSPFGIFGGLRVPGGRNRRLLGDLAMPARIRLGRAPGLGSELRADLDRGCVAAGIHARPTSG